MGETSRHKKLGNLELTGAMAERVVDRFKSIQVYMKQGRNRPFPGISRDFMSQPIHEQAAVW